MLSRSIVVSPRILWLQFIGAASVNSSQVESQVRSVKTHVISVYSPTNTAETSTKKAFYDQLSACISSIAKRDPLYILGDFNAKLDHSSAPFPIHKLLNENGELLAEFMDDLGLFSVLCSLRKPRSQWFTHCGPNGHKSRIDHCLARKKYKSSALNVHLMTPATVTSDHRLLRVEVRLRFAAHNQTLYSSVNSCRRTGYWHRFHNNCWTTSSGTHIAKQKVPRAWWHITRTFEASWHSRDHSPHSQPGLWHWADSSGMETVSSVTSLQERWQELPRKL